MMSSELSLSLSFFSLRRGVATPAVLAKLAAAGLGCWVCWAALGSFSLVDWAPLSVISDRDARLEGDVGTPDWEGAGMAPTLGGRLVLVVVLARPRSWGLLVRMGVRCEVERSRDGSAVVGGAGAGR